MHQNYLDIYYKIIYLLVASEKPNSGGRQQRQGGRFNDRERFNDRDRSDRQGDRLDNRTRQNEDRSSRGGRGGGRPRLSSREKDGVSCVSASQGASVIDH